MLIAEALLLSPVSCSFVFFNIHDHHHRVFCPRAGPLLQGQEPRLQFWPKAGLPLQTQEPRLQFCGRQVFHRKLMNQGCFLPGINRCDSFPLLFAPHSLYVWTDLKKSEKIPRGLNVELRRVNLTNWALRTSPKFTTGVKYQFQVPSGFLTRTKIQKSQSPFAPRKT